MENVTKLFYVFQHFCLSEKYRAAGKITFGKKNSYKNGRKLRSCSQLTPRLMLVKNIHIEISKLKFSSATVNWTLYKRHIQCSLRETKSFWKGTWNRKMSIAVSKGTQERICSNSSAKNWWKMCAKIKGPSDLQPNQIRPFWGRTAFQIVIIGMVSISSMNYVINAVHYLVCVRHHSCKSNLNC